MPKPEKVVSLSEFERLKSELRLLRKKNLEYKSAIDKTRTELVFAMRESARLRNLMGAVRDVPFPDGASTQLDGASTLPRCPVTPREMQVLALIVRGRSTKQLADDLGITFKTAVSHRTRLLSKFGVHDTASLVREAILGGWSEARSSHLDQLTITKRHA